MKMRKNSYRKSLPGVFSCLLLSFLLLTGLTVLPGTQKVVAEELPQTLIPGGMPFGVELHTKGVLIVGFSAVNESDGRCPAADAGMALRDIVIEVDHQQIGSAAEVADRIAASGGREMTFTVERSGRRMEKKLKPVKSESDGIYRSGIWIRDSAAGIGTVTFICPDDHTFAGLGHGICDADTGMLLPLSRGTVMNVVIGSVRKGQEGAPGELKGFFGGERIGALMKNTDCGAFGMLSELPKKALPAIEVGSADRIHPGEATILCTLDSSEGIRSYPIRIRKICDRKRENKNFLVEVTDPELIARTGGIVQGMSGSPIIQDGRLVGAITHVMVENPTQGYGIFIENMLRKKNQAAG